MQFNILRTNLSQTTIRAILPSGGSDESTTLSKVPRYPKDLCFVWRLQASSPCSFDINIIKVKVKMDHYLNGSGSIQ
jgi:hypothetical protein